jgi:hypothetical protein
MITQAIPFTSISPLLQYCMVLIKDYHIKTNHIEDNSLCHLHQTVAIPLVRSSISEPFWGSPCLATRSPPPLALNSYISYRHPRLRFTFKRFSISRLTTDSYPNYLNRREFSRCCPWRSPPSLALCAVGIFLENVDPDRFTDSS